MTQKLWIHENRKTLVCVDSYDSGILQGRFYTAQPSMEVFDSLTQLLVKMDAMLEETQTPQSYTSARTFSYTLYPEDHDQAPSNARKGILATFEIQILFRQHSSWQGMVVWQETGLEQSFRSVLELILLMDSALRGAEGKVAG